LDTKMARKNNKKPQHPVTAISLANLRPPAKPGEVRNPLGINRGRTYSDRYEELALGPLPEKIRLKINEQLGEELLLQGATWAQANALRRHIGAVVEGNTADAKELREAVEGKPMQRMELTIGDVDAEHVYERIRSFTQRIRSRATAHASTT
jgi:hypothetical protein